MLATTGCPPDFTAPAQLVSCHSGPKVSMRQMPSTASVCHQWPPPLAVVSQMPPEGAVRLPSIITPSVGVVCAWTDPASASPAIAASRILQERCLLQFIMILFVGFLRASFSLLCQLGHPGGPQSASRAGQRIAGDVQIAVAR